MKLNKLLYVIFTFIGVCTTGCKKEDPPYITKEEAEKIVASANPEVENVAFIYNNDIYFAANITKTPQKITNTPSAVKRFVKMSHDHTKFAYINSANYIEIVDNTGKLITTLTQYNQVKAFDWTADDKTLYILSNGNMYYYGTALSLSITYPGIIAGYSTEILSASVSVKGDFAYIIHAYAFTQADIYRLVIKPANSGNVITYDNSTRPYSMNYVNFSTNDRDMVLGYRDANASFYSYERLEFFTNLGSRPDFSYESSSNYGTPVYNSTLKYFVCGYTGGNFSNTVALSAINTTDASKNKISSTYLSTGNGLYTDWK